MPEDAWTLDELARRVGAALADEAYPGAPNGRVRGVPDARAIRWYTTIGLVDRPGAVRGRSARYGPRHLLQLVAVKRRQAAGHSLAAIQAELSGAADEALQAIARVPGDLLVPDPAEPDRGTAPDRGRFWSALPTVPTGPAVPARPAGPAASAPVRAAAERTEAGAPPPSRPAVPSAGPAVPSAGPAGTLTGVPLGAGVTVLLPGTPAAADLAAIRAAAAPLLDLLAARGLLVPTEGSPR